jgi:hypothetical protein
MRAVEAGELDDRTAWYEEIDVYADDARDARRQAEQEALNLYGPGAVLEPMPPGGSGGLVIGV